MSIKSEVRQIVGKTITGVIVKEGTGPRSQLFLTFSDGTYYEFYCGDSAISCTGGVDRGGVAEVLKYMSPRQQVVFQATEPSSQGSA
jgi:hypothetical protein